MILGLALTACTGEDRSGERPLAPVVQSVAVTVDGSVATMEGHVTASHNSTLLGCGFHYGNDTIAYTAEAEVQSHFFAQTDSLPAGTYYAVSFARNGVGKTYGDTLQFRIE